MIPHVCQDCGQDLNSRRAWFAHRCPQQGGLFDAKKAARTSDPDTSHAAAASMTKVAGMYHHAIIDALASAPFPLAAQQIADRTGLSYVAIGKRTSELMRAGLIGRTDTTHLNRSGRKAHRYRLLNLS